jgi:hypothetical protein
VLNGRVGREAARRREVAESGMTAFETETVESCCSLRIVPADLFRPFTFIEIRQERARSGGLHS